VQVNVLGKWKPRTCTCTDTCQCECRLAKPRVKLNSGLSPDFSIQLKVSLSETLSKRLSQKVKSPNVIKTSEVMLTEQVKTFIEILYLIIGYVPLRVLREFPGKRRKTFGLDKLTTKLLKKWTSKRMHGVAYRGLCVSLTRDAIGGSD